MIRFHVQPLRAEGEVLLPVGEVLEIASEACQLRHALVETCNSHGWAIHRRSRGLKRHVASETPPYEVAYTVGGTLLLAVWRA